MQPASYKSSLDECAVKALTTGDELSLDAFFALGGTDQKIVALANQFKLQNRPVLLDINQWERYKSINKEDLEYKVIDQLLLSSSSKDNPVVQAVLESDTGLKKIFQQFAKLYEQNQFEQNELLESIGDIVTLQLKKKTGSTERSIQADLYTVLNDHFGKKRTDLVFNSVRSNNFMMFKLLIKIPEDFSATDLMGNNLLITSVMHNSEECVRYLIEKGADINGSKRNKETPLMIACLRKNVQMCRILLEMGADPNLGFSQFRRNENPFTYAEGNKEILELLLAHGANVKELDNIKALHFAIDNGDAGLVRLYIQNGINVNQLNFGMTPLILACHRGQADIVRLLLRHPDTDLTVKYENKTALQIACEKKQMDVLKAFKEELSPERLCELAEKENALERAIKEGDPDIVRFFLEPPFKFDLAKLNAEKNNPLIIACHFNHLPVIQILLEHAKAGNVNINQKNIYNQTALGLSVDKGNLEAVKALLAHGADPLIWSGHSRPVHLALQMDRPDIAQELMKYEKKPDRLFIDFFLREKFLCHRFGCDAEFVTEDGSTVHLDGLVANISFEELSNSLRRFIDQMPRDADTPRDFDWEEIYSTFSQTMKNGNDIPKVMRDHKDNKVTSLPAGWKGHFTGLPIWNEYLIKSNRGEDSGSEPGLHIYTMRDVQKLQQSLQDVMDNKLKPEGRKIFLNDLDNSLILEKFLYIPHKDQHSGNCTWASAKLNLKGVIFLTLLSKKYSLEQAKIISDKLYKAWSEFDRNEALKEFIAYMNELKPIMSSYTPSQLKAEGIIPLEILDIVVAKCTRDRLLDELNLLLDFKPELLQTHDESNNTLLHASASENQPAAIAYLISKGLDVNSKNKLGGTPLWNACYLGKKKAVTELLKYSNLELNSRGTDNLTPLMAACLYGHFEIVQLLLSADFKKYSQPLDFKAQNTGGVTALMIAMNGDHKDIVNLLIEKAQDLNINSATADNNMTALSLACMKQNPDYVRALMKYVGPMDFNKPLNDGFTPVMIVCENNDINSLKVLLEHVDKLDFSAKNQNGETALEIAKNKGFIDILRELQKYSSPS